MSLSLLITSFFFPIYVYAILCRFNTVLCHFMPLYQIKSHQELPAKKLLKKKKNIKKYIKKIKNKKKAIKWHNNLISFMKGLISHSISTRFLASLVLILQLFEAIACKRKPISHQVSN